jgi:hypothetical protein
MRVWVNTIHWIWGLNLFTLLIVSSTEMYSAYFFAFDILHHSGA